MCGCACMVCVHVLSNMLVHFYIYSESSVFRTSIIRILDYPNPRITLHVTRGLSNYRTSAHTQYIQSVHFQSRTSFLCLKMAELLQSKCMYEHMHVYLYNVVFDCISLIQTFHLFEQNVCGI